MWYHALIVASALCQLIILMGFICHVVHHDIGTKHWYVTKGERAVRYAALACTVLVGAVSLNGTVAMLVCHFSR